jgi:hypothetical protein
MTVAADLLPMEIINLVVEISSFFKTKTQILTHNPIYHCRTKHTIHLSAPLGWRKLPHSPAHFRSVYTE